MRRIAEPGLERRAFQADRAGVTVTEPFDTGVFFAEPHTAGQQYNRGCEPHSAEFDSQFVLIVTQCFN